MMARGEPGYDDQVPEIPAPPPEERGIAGEDDVRALEALRRAWGAAYVICFDDAPAPGFPGWRAWRRDSTWTMLAAATAGELEAAIRADRTDGG
jgi:hypothetical protein